MGFLTDLVSRDGRNAIIGIRPDDTVHRWLDFADTAAVQDAIRRLERQKYDVYFALGSYAPKTRALTARGGRLVDNVVSLKSFWLDIDAGPDKIRKAEAMKSERARENKLANLYETYDDALQGMAESLQKTKLPDPTHVIRSGNGLHVYWAVDMDLPVDSWMDAQRALNERLRAAGLRIDPSRALDAASILRPPGTTHRGATAATGKKVVVDKLWCDPPIALETLLKGIKATKLTGAMKPKTASRATPGLAPASKEPAAPTKYGVTQEMIDASNASVERGDPPETAENISVVLQILEGIPASIDHDEWRNVIWAIKATKWKTAYEIVEGWSGQEADKYPDWEESLLKTWKSDGKGSKGTRIGVGRLFFIAEKHGMEGRHFFYNGEATTGSVVTANIQNIGEVEYHIPAMPDNFWRKKDEPGLWTRVGKVDEPGDTPEEWEDVKFYDHDLYITERVNGEGGKFRLSMMHYLPFDGIKRLDVPLTALGTVADMRKELIEYNVIANGERGWVHMSRYLQEQAKMFTQQRAATARIETLGWQSDGSFVIGNHAIARDKSMRPIVAVGNLEDVLDITEPTGDLEYWKSIAAFYNHAPFLPTQFAVLLSMGSPIYGMTGVTGGVVNMFSEGSGKGKTTALRVAASVWGNPGSSIGATGFIFGKTTDNSMSLHMTRMGSLPAMYDEITADVGDKRKMDILRTFIRYSTHSTDKQRMKSGSNELRKNTASHTNFALCTANRPLESIFPDMSADAERARTLDLPFAGTPSVEEFGVSTRDALQALGFGVSENFGLAGRVMLDYYIEHYDEVKKMVQDTQLRYHDQQTTMRDRFLVGLSTTAVVACQIANKLGLVGYDPQAIFDFSMQLIGVQHVAAKAGTVGDEEILNEFVRQNSEHLLITKVMPNGASIMLGGRTPRDPCMGRWYTNVNQLFLVRREFTSFCNDNRIDPQRALGALRERGAIISEKKQEYLGSGITGYNPGRHQCIIIDSVAAGLDCPAIEEGETNE